jgi:predicted nucleic acid-binding protein
VFLDADVLFSAAIGSRVCAAIWQLPGCHLLTSDYCWEEAARNLDIKGRSAGIDRLALAAFSLEIVRTPPAATWEVAGRYLPPSADSDRPVLAAAMAARAEVLVTGNTRDFGPLMAAPQAGLPVVLTPRGFLVRGPRPM